ncbi:hypothetical protein ACP4OV_019585 [Aristida adscensionis]
MLFYILGFLSSLTANFAAGPNLMRNMQDTADCVDLFVLTDRFIQN